MSHKMNNISKMYVAPTAADVLCGRGLTPFRHKGNHALRAKIALNSEKYVRCSSRKAKTVLIHEVILSVMKEGGRFLLHDKISERWFDGGLEAAKKRVGAAFRDASVPGKVKCLAALKDATQARKAEHLRCSVTKSQSPDICGSSLPQEQGTSNVSVEQAKQTIPSPPYTEGKRNSMSLRRFSMSLSSTAGGPDSLLSLFVTKNDCFEPDPISSIHDIDDDDALLELFCPSSLPFLLRPLST